MTTDRKVLCSIGTGPHEQLLARSGRTFRAYAEAHGYELDLRTSVPDSGRPASWARIPLLQSLLPRFDVVLWIDADAAVVDLSADIADRLGPDDLMGMVAHITPESPDPIPNCGVWVLRSGPGTDRLLADVWDATRFTDHKWWENAAVMEMLGYSLDPEVRLIRPTSLHGRTCFLGTEWNSVPVDPSPAPRIVHFPGMPLEERIAGLDAAVALLGPT